MNNMFKQNYTPISSNETEQSLIPLKGEVLQTLMSRSPVKRRKHGVFARIMSGETPDEILATRRRENELKRSLRQDVLYNAGVQVGKYLSSVMHSVMKKRFTLRDQREIESARHAGSDVAGDFLYGRAFNRAAGIHISNEKLLEKAAVLPENDRKVLIDVLRNSEKAMYYQPRKQELGDKIAENIALSPMVRKVAIVMQGINDSGMNPAVWKYKEMRTRIGKRDNIGFVRVEHLSEAERMLQEAAKNTYGTMVSVAAGSAWLKSAGGMKTAKMVTEKINKYNRKFGGIVKEYLKGRKNPKIWTKDVPEAIGGGVVLGKYGREESENDGFFSEAENYLYNETISKTGEFFTGMLTGSIINSLLKK